MGNHSRSDLVGVLSLTDESFAERRKRLLAERGEAPAESAPKSPLEEPKWDQNLVPQVKGDISDEEKEIDRVIASVSIMDAYNRYCGKSRPNPSPGQREGIKISCPKPDHPDKDPSAWFNLDNNLWHCGGCQEGGDIFDLAAFHYGYPVPGYKEGQLFHKLRHQIGEDYGVVIKKVAGGTVVYQKEPEPAPDGQTDTSPAEKAPVRHLHVVEPTAGEDEDDEQIFYPAINWKQIVPEDTFLRAYMESTSIDDSPEEYHFWHGLLALAHAVGRNITISDHTPVYSNLLVCLLGGTGVGKSRSRASLDSVIRASLPYADHGHATTGTKIIPIPASGEYLIKQFYYEGRDPNGRPMGPQPVNGIVDYDELAALLARAVRQGSTLKQTIMAFADTKNEVTSGSLTHGAFSAFEPFCSITASTQPKAIRNLLSRTDTGSGFLNRWVFAGGPPKTREIFGGEHSTVILDLGPAIDELKRVRAWGSIPRRMKLEDDALALATDWFHGSIHPIREKDESDLLKRLDLVMKKLMLLFTINEKKSTVTLENVERAKALQEYIIQCYGILNENIGITLSSEIATEIMRHARRYQERNGKGITTREIGWAVKRKNYSPDQIKRTLETLVALDWLELEKSSGGVGRPSVRYRVVKQA